MQKLFNWLVGAVLNYVSLWLDRQKARALEVKVKKMECSEATRKAEERIKNDARRADNAPESPSTWNRGAGWIAVIALAVSAGCCGYVESRWPVIDPPPRPAVPEEPAEWTEREKVLAGYGVKLENAIESYNDEAKAHNREHGYD